MLIILYILSSAANAFLAIKLSNGLLKYRTKKVANTSVKINKLPSVSVLIPARNEQIAMREFLERVLSSDYPKMEIIVLDSWSEICTR